MARANTAERELYAANGIYGSLAYSAGAYAQPETFGEEAAESTPRRQSQVKLKAEVATRSNPVRVFMYVLGFALAAAILVFVLLEYVQITAISDQTATLRSELAELQNEEARLLIAYESTFNLTEIENYAREELGMVSVSNGQRHYLVTGGEDKAVVLQEPEGEESFLGSAKLFLSSILEYFR